MTKSIKTLFIGYLSQLTVITEKVPENLFTEALHVDMFSLEINATVAANFLLRGYCPLIGKEVVLSELSGNGKVATLDLMSEIKARLMAYPDVNTFDDSILLHEKAGFAQVTLPQRDFVFQYIIPNFMFHMSMVYAIARKNGVSLSKGDFDGLHSYPPDFSFIT